MDILAHALWTACGALPLRRRLHRPLSGRTYWTGVNFDRADNNLMIATRFRSNLR